MGRALLIIDMQQVLVPVVWRGDELVARIAVLAASARMQNVPVVAIQQTGPAGTPFEPDDPGWQLSTGLGLRESDCRIRKSAIDSFFQSDLGNVLAVRDVDTVVVTGVATDYCVDATVRSALSRGLNVELVSDGHAPAAVGNPDAGLAPEQIIAHHNVVLSRAVHPGGRLRLVSSADVFSH